MYNFTVHNLVALSNSTTKGPAELKYLGAGGWGGTQYPASNLDYPNFLASGDLLQESACRGELSYDEISIQGRQTDCLWFKGIRSLVTDTVW